MKEAETAMAAADYATAVLTYQAALEVAPDAATRVQIYHGLADANTALGNDRQAELAIDGAIREAEDEAGRKEAASWKRPRVPE